MLEDGVHDVPAGKVAAVVTMLEMRKPPPFQPYDFPAGVSLRHVIDPALDWYRALFRRVGADWLWYSRLKLDDKALSEILTDRGREVWTLEKEGDDLALLELDFRKVGACEISFFGLATPLIGQGAGRALMAHAIGRGWTRPITRLHLQTCTLDSPQALGFYRRAGFEPTRQRIEIADDPRLTGALPAEVAPQWPVFSAG